MSGHSKWASIKHKKASTDAKRGKAFSRLIKEITIAAKMGGGSIDMNPRLRTAVQAAKDINMPADNITRAIKKGTGELPGVTYEDMTYEGYGPGGVAILVEISTDNKNRTAADIRHTFSKNNGNLGESGCVSWMFNKKGLIQLNAGGKNEDEIMEAALEAGADDIENNDDGTFGIKTNPTELNDIRDALEKMGFKVTSAEVILEPTNTVKVEGKQAEQCLRLMEALEDSDDVNSVSANFDISDEMLEQLGM